MKSGLRSTGVCVLWFEVFLKKIHCNTGILFFFMTAHLGSNAASNGFRLVRRHLKRSEHQISTRKEWQLCFGTCRASFYCDCCPRVSVNAEFYSDVLTDLRRPLREKRRGKLTTGVLLQHDKARAHTAEFVQNTAVKLGFELLPHPPYSPDLAPSDYWLFPQMTRQTAGERFENIQGLSGTLGRWAGAQTEEWFAKCQSAGACALKLMGTISSQLKNKKTLSELFCTTCEKTIITF